VVAVEGRPGESIVQLGELGRIGRGNGQEGVTSMAVQSVADGMRLGNF